MWETLWKVCGKPAAAGNGAGAGQAGRGAAWCGTVDRGVVWCGTAGRGAAWCGTVSRGVVWCGVAAAGCAVAIVRSRTRELRRARWLAFFPREKALDKLCKSILDWKQEITQEAARDRRRRMGRDASTASGEQSSASSPRGEGLGLAQNLPNEKTCMEGWLPCTFRVRWGFRRGGPGLTQAVGHAPNRVPRRVSCAGRGPGSGCAAAHARGPGAGCRRHSPGRGSAAGCAGRRLHRP